MEGTRRAAFAPWRTPTPRCWLASMQASKRSGADDRVRQGPQADLQITRVTSDQVARPSVDQVPSSSVNEKDRWYQMPRYLCRSSDNAPSSGEVPDQTTLPFSIR